jgi:hypothetical protein
VLQLKSAWRDGTTHIVMSPLEFMQRLAALVPRPRLHLIRFHGVLAPHARLRAAIVPGPAQKPSEHAEEHAHGAPVRTAASTSRSRLKMSSFPSNRLICAAVILSAFACSAAERKRSSCSMRAMIFARSSLRSAALEEGLAMEEVSG